jgi:membrane protease YdiL (CAAX protease family)
MDPERSSTQKHLFLRIFLSPDEPRLRTGWRLLLHTLLLGLITSILLLALLFMPVSIDGTIFETNLLSLVIEFVSIGSATWLARRFVDRRSFLSLGFALTRQAWMDLVIGFAIPGLLMGLVFTLELSLGWTTFERWAWQGASLVNVLIGMSSGLIAFILVGFSEEILSRGYHLQNLKDGLGLGWALLLSSLIFAWMHTANPNSSWISMLGILLAGYFLAYGWVRTGQLWLSIGLHIGWNFFEGNVFGFPVSGLSTFRLIEHHPTGPSLITGGAFGPEAGIIILPAMALGLLLIHSYTRRIRGQSKPTPSSTPLI